MTAPRIWTPLDLIRWTTDFFKRKGLESPRLQAELLLAEVLKCERMRLYVDFEKPLKEDELAQYRAYVKRRAESREPLQYVVGHAPFLDLSFKVTPAVLIPRPETEELADWGVKLLAAIPVEIHPELRALDLGTGSGCIALTIAAKVERARVTAVDCSKEALAVFFENIKRVAEKRPGLETRVEPFEGDLFVPLPPERKGTYHLIVSNPPYIDPDLRATLMPEVRDFEPASALFCEEKGTQILKRIIAGAGEWLLPGGKMGLELSPEQAPALKQLLENTDGWSEVEIKKDLHGRERFLMGTKKSE